MGSQKLEDSPFKNIYDTYNGTIKDLLADIESRYQKFPVPIYNEIRAVFDHVARCYDNSFSENAINHEVSLAEGHIRRIIFECYKYLYVYQNKYFQKFERKTNNVDLRSIDDRKFYDEYSKLRKGARISVKKAKKIESKDPQEAFTLFKEAYDMAVDLEDLIDKYSTQIWQAKTKHFLSVVIRVIIWLLVAVLAGIISRGFIALFIPSR